MNLSLAFKGRLAILATFVAAILLNIMPMPLWAEPFRPDWVALTLIYWCVAAPHYVNVGTGWVLGLVLDVLYGSLLGLHALAKSVIAYAAVRLHLKLRMFPRWQQAGVVLVLLMINQVLLIWIRSAVGRAPQTLAYWTPSIVGMLAWPWLFVILRDVRRRAKVS